ncbi:hypothetical protein SADUNF_Sadunf09G0037700 [Salix dunnii]|uniref:Uncharacterized protein n=1 Tax=Salix dunnii TaxID=1413687 RepID=A0A835JTY1_9ROSI|nr:hypothetical protein SADUNF_Sadunf09G0037700 [Salix dunnii]
MKQMGSAKDMRGMFRGGDKTDIRGQWSRKKTGEISQQDSADAYYKPNSIILEHYLKGGSQDKAIKPMQVGVSEFLIDFVWRLPGGMLKLRNCALVKNNALVGDKIAVTLLSSRNIPKELMVSELHALKIGFTWQPTILQAGNLLDSPSLIHVHALSSAHSHKESPFCQEMYAHLVMLSETAMPHSDWTRAHSMNLKKQSTIHVT